MLPSKPTLEAPLTSPALRRSVAGHCSSEWMAYARALRVAGYQVDVASLADQLLRDGRADVQDAFGNEVTLRVRGPGSMSEPGQDEPELALAGSNRSPARDDRGVYAR